MEGKKKNLNIYESLGNDGGRGFDCDNTEISGVIKFKKDESESGI